MQKSLGYFMVWLLAYLPFLSSEVNVSPLFSDGAVFQRNIDVPIWGWAKEGSSVTINFKGQQMSSKANAKGKWMLKLNPMKADAKGAEMKISVNNETKVIKDILIGEVWICGGQSNMDFNLRQLSGKSREPKYEPIGQYIRDEIKNAKDPLLRQIKVPRQRSAFKELNSFKSMWQKVSPNEVASFTGTGYFFGRELRKETGVPVGLLNCNWGGTLVEPWIPMWQFDSTPKLKAYYKQRTDKVKLAMKNWDEKKVNENYQNRLAAWQKKVDEAKAKKENPPRRPRRINRPDIDRTIPSTLYNAMTHTLVPYAIRGAIWYQGESNRKHYPERYSEHFSAMIEGWRKAWGQGDFPFYYCQLAQFFEPNKDPLDNDGWTTVIDQQRLTLSLNNTGMAVLNDIGEAKDIHPKNKVDAGKRLSRWALKFVYGKDIVYSGPLYKDSKIEGNKVIVSFDSVGSGLMVGNKHLLEDTKEVQEPLKRFQICGKDRKWKWAQAKIIAKDKVEVSHPEIKEPDEVRYAWSPNAEGANLYNKEGLPASLFKTK